MTFEKLTNSLPLITGALFVISILFVFLAVFYFRRGRRAPYWTQRRTAGQQGLRILMMAVFFLTIATISCGLTLIYNYIEPDEIVEDNNTAVAFETNIAEPVTIFPTTVDTEESNITPTEIIVEATVEPSATEELIPTEVLLTTTLEPSITSSKEISTQADISTTPAADIGITSEASDTDEPPSATPTFTATNLPTETWTATPSFTSTETATLAPSETLVPSDTPTPETTAIVQTSNLSPFRTPSSLADLDILVVSSGVSNRQQPLNSGLSFASDLTRLYYFVKFENMTGGSLWQVQLYRADTLVYHRTALWGNSTSGETYFFIGLPDGFASGNYKLQLIIGEQPNPITTTSFTVSE